MFLLTHMQLLIALYLFDLFCNSLCEWALLIAPVLSPNSCRSTQHLFFLKELFEVVTLPCLYCI